MTTADITEKTTTTETEAPARTRRPRLPAVTAILAGIAVLLSGAAVVESERLAHQLDEVQAGLAAESFRVRDLVVAHEHARSFRGESPWHDELAYRVRHFPDRETNFLAAHAAMALDDGVTAAFVDGGLEVTAPVNLGQDRTPEVHVNGRLVEDADLVYIDEAGALHESFPGASDAGTYTVRVTPRGEAWEPGTSVALLRAGYIGVIVPES